jgi:quercetin dioxygenase-like cupin family protein
MMLIRMSSRSTARKLLRVAPFTLVLLFVIGVGSAQAPHRGVARQVSALKLETDGQPSCLLGALENGDPDTGSSTFLLKAPPNCVVPAHYHTAEEQLIVVRGEVSTGMEGMSDTVLSAGGFAMMPGKAVHWFTCTAKAECLMFVTFDRKYDIVWIKQPK